MPWEPFVLNELHAHLGRRVVHYWRSTHGNEIDLVLADRGRRPAAIECTWSAADLDPANLRAFRGRYPDGANFVVATDVDASYVRRYGDLAVTFVSLRALIDEVTRGRRQTT